jgi:hypothetical protein
MSLQRIKFFSKDISVKASRRGRHLLAMMALNDSCFHGTKKHVSKRSWKYQRKQGYTIAQPSLYHLP